MATPDLGTKYDPFPPTATDPVDHDALHAADRLNIVESTSDFTTPGATYPIHARQLMLSARGGTLDALARSAPTTRSAYPSPFTSPALATATPK